jgi:hypothetical protein
LSTGPVYPQVRRGGTITFALYQEPELLNTFIGTQTALFEVTIFVVEGLLDYNEKGEFFPRLAREVPRVRMAESLQTAKLSPTT